jgi:hypothetical protein
VERIQTVYGTGISEKIVQHFLTETCVFQERFEAKDPKKRQHVIGLFRIEPGQSAG